MNRSALLLSCFTKPCIRDHFVTSFLPVPECNTTYRSINNGKFIPPIVGRLHSTPDCIFSGLVKKIARPTRIPILNIARRRRRSTTINAITHSRASILPHIYQNLHSLRADIEGGYPPCRSNSSRRRSAMPPSQGQTLQQAKNMRALYTGLASD